MDDVIWYYCSVFCTQTPLCSTIIFLRTIQIKSAINEVQIDVSCTFTCIQAVPIYLTEFRFRILKIPCMVYYIYITICINLSSSIFVIESDTRWGEFKLDSKKKLLPKVIYFGELFSVSMDLVNDF